MINLIKENNGYSEFIELINYSRNSQYLFNTIDGIEVKIPACYIKKSKIVAKIRDENHKKDTRADFNPNATLIGLYGESAFGYFYKLPVDWSIKLHDEYDFKTKDFFIDAKTTEFSPYLSIKQRRLHTENNFIYVYCVCRLPFNDAKIVSWINGSDVLAIAKLKSKMGDQGLEYYYEIPFQQLNTIHTLKI